MEASLSEVLRALDEERPLDALALLETAGEEEAELTGEALRCWCRAHFQAGHLARLRTRWERRGPDLEGEDRRLLALYGALALVGNPEVPPALALEELLPLGEGLSGPEKTLHEASLARVFLHCGAVELSRRGDPGLVLDLLRGDPAALEAEPEHPWLRARTLAARGDWAALGELLASLDLEALQGGDPLRDLALYGEALGRPEWTRLALEKLPEEELPPASRPGRRYRNSLALARSGSLPEARTLLETLLHTPGWVGLASRSLAGRLASGEVPPPPPEIAAPLGSWPGVPACVASVVRGLWQLGERLPPRELQRKIRLEGGDLVCALELVDFLRERGIAVTQLEASPEALVGLSQEGRPVVLRLLLPTRGATWGLLAGFDPGLELYRVLLPDRGELLEIPADCLRALQQPMGEAALVLGDSLATRGASLALETLDEAVRKARSGELDAALSRLEKGRGYRRHFMPLSMLQAELTLVGTLGGGLEGREALFERLASEEESWPEESWPLLYRARFHLESGEKDEAYRQLLRAVRQHRVEAEVWTELGDLQEEKGEPEEAARSWWKAHHINPLYSRPAEQLSRHYRRSKRFDLALGLCEAALEANPENPYNWEMLGILLGETGGDEERIEASLRRALEINPRRPYAYGFLCDLYLRRGQAREAIATLEEGAGQVEDPYPCLVRMAEIHFDRQDFRSAIEAAERALERRGGEAAPTALMGASYGRCGQTDRCSDLLQRAISLDPGDPWPVRELAIHLREAGRLGEAREVLEEGRLRLPEDVGIRAQMALTYEADGDLSRGLDAAREALELAGPDAFEVVRLVARLAYTQGGAGVSEAVWKACVASSGDRAEASKQFVSFLLDYEAFAAAEQEGRLALQLNPGDEELSAWYGYALVRLDRWDESVPWLRRSLEKVPDYPFARSVLLDALTEMGEDEEAVRAYQECPGALTPLGHECAFVALVRLGRLEEALRAARKAALAVPGSAGFFHRRAARLLLDDLFQFEMACREAELAVEASPEDSRAHEALAWCLAGAHRFAEAEQAMDRMLQTGADSMRLLRFRRYLAERRGDHAGEEACCRELARLHTGDEEARRHWLVEAACAALRLDPGGGEHQGYLEGLQLGAGNWVRLAEQALELGQEELSRTWLGEAGPAAGPRGARLLVRGALRKGDYAAALELARKGAEGFPGEPRLLALEARARLLLGDLEGARAPQQAAQEQVGHSDSPVQFLEAMLCLLTGDLAGAREAFERASELEPGRGPSLARAMAAWARGEEDLAREGLRLTLERSGACREEEDLVRRILDVTGLVLPERELS